ncbi:phosphotransferase [Streptomyces sp. NBC_01808]|uniref:phosphotransferase n=1 Tax=Streptomyces sp. NBC_01808 TaxID=2975947 RepID=UPI002DDB9DE9|nr:phosphotransferase [Streptomyces sp. NBC_01808]WSA36399.1 phosphotransferase [Streptomyces sp. NBC_01808]
MELIGRGRDADVYALAEGRVLRRYRAGGPRKAAAEARLMTHLGERGFPVPQVYDADATDLVMERLEGPTMATALRRRPWRCAAYGRMLARLHDRLHTVPAPEFLPPSAASGSGDRVLHLDLHPENVILTARGPYVIDWPNAAAGAPACDVAMTVCILRGVELNPPETLCLRVLLRTLLRTTSADPTPGYPHALPARLADPNLIPSEARRLRRALGG